MTLEGEFRNGSDVKLIMVKERPEWHFVEWFKDRKSERPQFQIEEDNHDLKIIYNTQVFNIGDGINPDDQRHAERYPATMSFSLNEEKNASLDNGNPEESVVIEGSILRQTFNEYIIG